MRLGLLTVPFSALSFEDMVKHVATLGVQDIELGTGGYTNNCHCDVQELLLHPHKIKEMRELLDAYGMGISALSCHGNPVHPNAEIARRDHKIYQDTLKIAELLGVDTVVTFSGCPGGDAGATKPNWVTCPWPPEYREMLEYQWNDCLIPYWENAAKMAEDSGVRVAIEMHPGFCVYNAETMKKLSEAVGKSVGANFDPSHLFWQGTDAVTAIYELNKLIYYVHAKDCHIDSKNVAKFGVLDTKHFGELQKRSWLFRTVGYGHDEQTWRDIISALRIVGYDKTISIEHEDALMSIDEGIKKAVAFLKDILIEEPSGTIWWA